MAAKEKSRSTSVGLLHQEGCFGVCVPAVPQIVVGLAVGDQAQRIVDLFLVEVAEGSGTVHAAVHLVRLGRAGRAAEVTYCAVAAGAELVHVAADDAAEGRRGQRSFNTAIGEQMAAVEVRQTDEFAAWIEVAVCRQREEGAATTAGRDVAHQSSRGRRKDADEDVGEVGDHQLATGLAVQRVTAVQRGEEGFYHVAVGRLDAACARQGAAHCVEHAGWYFFGVEEFDHLRQIGQIFGSAGADCAPRAIAPEPVHGGEHLVMYALATPGLARRIGDGSDRTIEREADAYISRGEEFNRFVVEQRAVGL